MLDETAGPIPADIATPVGQTADHHSGGASHGSETQPSSGQHGYRFTKAELSRLEGFGDNCEFGFVLRRLGFEDGMLLRWASISPDSLLATLRGEFQHIYEFENLTPQNPKMVHERHYGTAWHSEMRSTLQAGRLAFEEDEAVRRVIHAKEAEKLAYLIAKLRRKFSHPNPIFVIKANAGIAASVLEGIHYQLYRRVSSRNVTLLEVCADPARAGRIEAVGANLLRGYVTRFASYNRADEADDASWHAVMAGALAHGADAAAEPAPVPSGRAGALILPFPEQREPRLSAPIEGDLRAGLPRLLRGNDWCRAIDDVYRLHATGVGGDATELRWSGAHLAPGTEIRIAAACAIADSQPVRARVQIQAWGGAQVGSELVYQGMTDSALTLAVPDHFEGPLTVSLTVEPLARLRMGERAVIDIQPVHAIVG